LKVRVLPENLVAGLRAVMPAVTRNPAILSHGQIRLRAEDTLELIATDKGDFFLSVRIGAKVETEGTCLADPSLLKIASRAGEGPVTLRYYRKKLLAITDNSETSMETIETKTFPIPPLQNTGGKLEIEKRHIQAMAISVGTDMNVPKFAGIHVYEHEGDIYMLTTVAGMWMSVAIIQGELEQPVCIPFKYLATAFKSLDDSEVGVSKSHVVVTGENGYAILPLYGVPVLEGLAQKLMRDPVLELKTSQTEMLNALDLCTLFSGDGSPTWFRYDGGKLRLESGATTLGFHEAELHADVVSGEATILEKFSSKRVSMAMRNIGPGCTLSFCPYGNIKGRHVIRVDGDGIHHLIGPMGDARGGKSEQQDSRTND
jgi:hypothetical protein